MDNRRWDEANGNSGILRAKREVLVVIAKLKGLIETRNGVENRPMAAHAPGDGERQIAVGGRRQLFASKMQPRPNEGSV